MPTPMPTASVHVVCLKNNPWEVSSCCPAQPSEVTILCHLRKHCSSGKKTPAFLCSRGIPKSCKGAHSSRQGHQKDNGRSSAQSSASLERRTANRMLQCLANSACVHEGCVQCGFLDSLLHYPAVRSPCAVGKNTENFPMWKSCA